MRLHRNVLYSILHQRALPSELYSIYEGNYISSLPRRSEFSDSNVCHPADYQRHHSAPCSVTRLRAI